MKGKSVFLIAAIAIILVVIVLVTEKPFKEETGETSTPDQLTGIKRKPVFENVNRENCFRIEISQLDGRSTASLARIDDTWYTNPTRKYLADEKKIKRIFDTIEEVEKGEVVSTNPKNHPKFSVDQMSGTRVKMFGEHKALIEDVYVGKMGSSYMSPSTYVRNEGSDEVLSVNGYMMSLFQPGQENWRERTIMDIEPDNITGFTLEKPGEPTIKLARLASGDDWTCLQPPDIQLKKDIGQRMVNSFARLRASSFVDDYPLKPLEEYGLTYDAFVVKASLKDYTSTPTLYIGRESLTQKNQWYVRAAGKDHVTLIYKYNKDNLTKTLGDLQPTPTPTPTPEATPTEISLKKRVEEEAREKAEEIEKMSEGEKKEAARKKLEEILKQSSETPEVKKPE